MAKYNYLIYRVCFSNIYLFLYTLYPCPTEILFQKIKIIWSFQINKHIILSGVNINSCLVHLISDLFSVIQWINVLPYGDYFTLEANTKIRKPASPTSHYRYRHAKSRDFHLWSLHLQEVILNSWSYITLTFLQNSNIIYVIVTLIMGNCLHGCDHWQGGISPSRSSLFVFVN